MPAAVVCARIVDIIDSKNGRQDSYSFWNDVVAALNKNYATSAFKEKAGNYFPSIISHPERFVKPCSTALLEWIRSLKQAGKVIFLMTSSFVDYTIFLMKYAIGDDWKELFDFVITNARKPRFFEEAGKDQPFYVTGDDHLEHAEADAIHSHEIYSQGNARLLHQFLEKKLGKSNLKFLYFGDSLKSDVFPPASYAGWDTVVVLEEMEAEEARHRLSRQGKDSNGEDPIAKKPRFQDVLSNEEKLIVASHQWSSFFCHQLTSDSVGKDTEKNNGALCTYWADVIATYSCLAVPTLDYLVDVPLDHVFKPTCPTTLVSFYPRIPSTIT